jgi:tRNA (guanine37-N1)-methyltransferase
MPEMTQDERAQLGGPQTSDVLVSGDHAKTKVWREAQALKLTRERRPDLLKQYRLAAKRGTKLR